MLTITHQALSELAAKARAYADVFQLPLQHRVWKGQTGDFMGSGIGSSLDFQDHRSYMPGDDPRHINWQAYARTGSYTMKLYREEVRPMIDLVLDVSDSMWVQEEKQNRALELFYFVFYSALRSGAAISTSVVRGDRFEHLTDDAVHSHAWSRRLDGMPETSAAASPDLRPLPFRAQSMRVLVSDLLFTESPDKLLRALTRNKGRGLILAPYVNSEANPDWDGNYEFVEAESRLKHPHRVERNLLKKYLTAYQRHFDIWKTLCRKYDVALARIPSETDFQAAMQAEAVANSAVEIM
ncbi:MAG: DUF58 domain-containing protein [Verrucomicrobiales bacterium]|nr:DUF58 domain-containing protein [Verrucomicrobiales bacterium]